jgi:translation initiation factor 2 alpha subunit (eIF-2alpha)
MNITNFYSNSEPQIRGIVFIKPIQHKIKSENGVYVEMIEFNNLEGFIPCTEINRWKVNLDTFFKYDKIYPCLVLRKYNENPSTYDLSYIKIKKTDIKLLEDAYNYMLKIVNIIKKLIVDEKMSDESAKYLIENTIHKSLSQNLYDECISEQKNIIKLLYNEILINPNKLFKYSKYSINEIENFVQKIKERITIKPMILNKEFKLIILENNSLEKIKNTINNINKLICDSNINSKIECKSSPIYYFRVEDFDKEKLKSNIKLILQLISNEITNYMTINDLTFEETCIRELDIQYNN